MQKQENAVHNEEINQLKPTRTDTDVRMNKREQ